MGFVILIVAIPAFAAIIPAALLGIRVDRDRFAPFPHFYSLRGVAIGMLIGTAAILVATIALGPMLIDYFQIEQRP